MEELNVMVADSSHIDYVDTILQTISDAAKVRGTGIAKRSPEYVATKMREGKAVIALQGRRFAGFSYIETWGNKHYVTTSGLIVHPDFRGLGLAKKIKDLTFTLARKRWPKAKIFSLTSGAAVMKMNTQLGYRPVTFKELTDDDAFWRGCEGCINVDVLHRTNRRYCICTAMLFDPEEEMEAHPQPLPREGSATHTTKIAQYKTADSGTYGKLKEFAYENRRNPTEAEHILWGYLKGMQQGVRFRRQHIIGQFIADLSCPRLKLIIEIDGGYHQLPSQQASDRQRTAWLEAQGYTVMRFTNEEIIADTKRVLNEIQKEIERLKIIEYGRT